MIKQKDNKCKIKGCNAPRKQIGNRTHNLCNYHWNIKKKLALMGYAVKKS